MTNQTPLDRRAELAEPSGRLERMMEIRLVEDRIQSLFGEGLVHGTTHTAQGQEAVAVGLATSLRATDYVTCTYRGHGVALALGMKPATLLGEVLGRTNGSIGGVGGSMHLCDADIGLLPTFAIVGAGIPVAAGAALTAQVTGTDGLAVAVFGDGATNIGAFHEAINLAAIWRLPTLFLIENNVYGEYSRINTTTPITDLADRAASYGIAGNIVDGQDVERVATAVSEAAERIRGGGGPEILECKTYRYAGHSRSDTAPYRPEGEMEEWLERDPIDRYGEKLTADGILAADGVAKMREHVADQIEQAVETVKAAPRPDVDAMFANVYAP